MLELGFFSSFLVEQEAIDLLDGLLCVEHGDGCFRRCHF